MTAFEHISALLSFVYALALTHLLSRAGELIIARKRVTFSGLTTLGMVNAGLLVVFNWIDIWNLRSVAAWDIASISIQLALVTSIYLACVLISPKPSEEGLLDMESFFWKQRIYFYAALVSVLVLSMLANLDFLKSADVGRFLQENSYTLIFFVPTVAALVFSSRAVQWLAGLGFAAGCIGFAIVFDASLR
ncbi:MAG: hypothetical protein JOY77_10155 [Alphaproteobacteria bacterium]|nr:hypothetical protein [Alphaproteobacteria bacterium]MBV9063271.1 hypothetical protein [Alphaproteobacteria bacterium]